MGAKVALICFRVVKRVTGDTVSGRFFIILVLLFVVLFVILSVMVTLFLDSSSLVT